MRREAGQPIDDLRARLGGAPMSAAVVRDDAVLFATHTAPETLFPIYSLTKTYIAVLTLLTVRAGHLSLETTLADRFPDLPQAHRITLRQLLAHRAGLPDYGALTDYRRAIADAAPPWSDEEFAEHTYRRGLLFEPGTAWAYANPGYALLVNLLEQVWQRPLAELLTMLVTEPLGLSRTRFARTLDDPDICPASSPALSRDGRPQPVKEHYPVGWVWHRVIVSDAVDSARLLDAVLGRRWLGDRLTDAMTSLSPIDGHEPTAPAPAWRSPRERMAWTTPSYGLGLMGEPQGRRGPVFGHNGAGPGYSTSAYYVADTGLAVAVVAATERADAVLDTVFSLHDAISRP